MYAADGEVFEKQSHAALAWRAGEGGDEMQGPFELLSMCSTPCWPSEGLVRGIGELGVVSTPPLFPRVLPLGRGFLSSFFSRCKTDV